MPDIDTIKEVFQRWITKVIMEDPRTTQDIADAIDVNRSLLMYYKQGKRHPTLQTLAKLREAFGLDINALVDGDLKVETPKPKPPKKIRKPSDLD